MLRQWFQSILLPVTQDARETARIAAFLRGILLFGMVTTAIATAGLLFFVPDQGLTLIFNGGLLLTLAILWVMAQRNQVKAASILFIVVFTVYMGLALYTFGGIDNPLIGLYIILVLIGGTLLGQFGVLLVSLLAGISTLLILYLQTHNLLPPYEMSSAVGNWIVFLTIMMSGAAVMYLWFGNIRNAVNEASHELEERQRAEAALRNNEARLRLLLSTLPDLVLVIDEQGIYREIFTGNHELLVSGTDDFLGKRVTEVIQSKVAHEILGIIQRALISGEIQTYQYEMKTRLGKRSFNAQVVPYEMDGEKLVLWVARDNTIQQKIENELRASEERYRLISSVISDYSFATRIDPDGSAHEEWVAGAFENISGFAFDEYVASGGWRAHLHPDDVEKDVQDMAMLQKNQRVTSELRTIHKDGSLRWVRIYAQPVWDENQARLTGIYGAVQNITEKKLAEERELRRQEMLKRVIDLGKNVTRITDLDECLQTIHQSVQKGLGFDRVGLFLYDSQTESIQGSYGTDRNGNMESTSWFKQAIETYSEWRVALENPHGVSVINDYQDRHKHGPESEMFGVKQHITLAAWAGDKPVGLIAADNLVSGRPIFQEDLEALQLFAGYAGLAIENARLNSQLEERVTQRTAELESVVNELEAFSYTISHDLRAPLRGIHGYISILLEEVGDDVPYQAKVYLDKVRRNAHTMGELVDDLLAFLRLNRKEIRKTPINMEQLAYRTYDALRVAEPPDRQIEFTCEPLPGCQGDPELVSQALTDLFSNALKFTRTREIAKIHAGSFTQDGKTVYFIRDNGIGFDMRFYSKLFGVFQRLHAPDTPMAFEGTGVGLAIVHRIIQRHHGRIWADAAVDKGATFFFTLE
jgi:PAS domain S-box-containing protein